MPKEYERYDGVPDGHKAEVSSGGTCELTKRVGVSILGDSAIIFSRDKSFNSQTEDSLDIDQGAIGTKTGGPINRGIITHAEDVPSYYAQSEETGHKPQPDPRGKEFLGELRDSRNLRREPPMLTHGQILDNLGIQCRKNGVRYDPTLSIDDVEKITKPPGPSISSRETKIERG